MITCIGRHLILSLPAIDRSSLATTATLARDVQCLHDTCRD
ncbi:hypothetical protein [Streptoalloteichus hindustanus]|nr:hypothetical protein [Streptoalloteichus hindustanus]